MATNDDANALGFITPEDTDLISDGDDAISNNARKSTDLFQTYRMNRGAIPPQSDISTFNTPTHSGLWHVNNQSTAETITGTPAGLGSNVQFELMVFMGSTGLQYLYPYGYYENLPFCYVRRLSRAVSPKTWTEWVPWDPSDSENGSDVVDGTEGAWATNSAQVARFLGVMGGPIDTEGKAAVAIRFDHGLANFQSKVLPLTKTRGFKVSQAYNPRNWHYPENAGVTPDDLNSWVAAGDVEIWNHSASHQPADTEEDLYDEIVNGLHEIEQQLPAAKGQVWGWVPPGVSSGDYGGYNAGKTPAGWDTYAGRLILAYHAVAAGSLIGTQLHPLDGVPRPGVARVQMDSMTVEAIKARVDDAISGVKGLQLMLHPSLLDSSGYITTAQFTEVLDYLVAKRDAGQIVTLSPYELTIARATAGAGAPAWSEITGKPSTYPPAPHTHEMDDVNGLDAELAMLEPQNLGTQHLDTVTARGIYYQPFAARSTKAQGYPWEGVAGTLRVELWNPANGNSIATFSSWDRGIAKRTLYLGSWRPWLDALGNPIT